VISSVFIRHYTENFTNENPFHKIVYILLAVSMLGCIAHHNASFRSFMCHMYMAHGPPNPCSLQPGVIQNLLVNMPAQ